MSFSSVDNAILIHIKNGYLSTLSNYCMWILAKRNLCFFKPIRLTILSTVYNFCPSLMLLRVAMLSRSEANTHLFCG